MIAELPLEHMTTNWLLFPSGPLKVLWDSFIGLLIFYSVLVIPMQVIASAHHPCGSIFWGPQPTYTEHISSGVYAFTSSDLINFYEPSHFIPLLMFVVCIFDHITH